MGYRNWAERNSEAIQATSAIVSTIGIAVIGATFVVSVYSVKVASRALQENIRATEAQALFNVQRFGFEIAQDLFDADFRHYLAEGVGPSNAAEDQMRRFYKALSGYSVIYFQRKFGLIRDLEWGLYKQELCAFLQKKGANHFFDENSIENFPFDPEFKKMVLDCRTR